MVAPKKVVRVAVLGTEARPHVTGILIDIKGGTSGYAQSESVSGHRPILNLERRILLGVFLSREQPAVTDHYELATESSAVF